MNESTIEVPVALNSDVALECDVLDAKPPPQIKWFDDQGEIQEIKHNNNVRYLDNKRYLYLRSSQLTHFERRYYCAITNVNLSQEVSAPTRYALVDNLTQGVLMDYKQIGDLTAFIDNTSVEFSYVGGVFGTLNSNETFNRLNVNGDEVAVRGSIGIYTIVSPGFFMLEALVSYSGMVEAKHGTLTVNRELNDHNTVNLLHLTYNSELNNIIYLYNYVYVEIPRIMIILGNEREHFIGEKNLIYICEFEGFPLPNIAFYFNGAPILTNSVNIMNNTLTIPSPQVYHSGIYQCIVSNEFGDDQAAWLLEIRQPSKLVYSIHSI